MERRDLKKAGNKVIDELRKQKGKLEGNQQKKWGSSEKGEQVSRQTHDKLSILYSTLKNKKFQAQQHTKENVLYQV